MCEEFGIIPKCRLIHNDNWGYDLTCFCDVFTIEYFENENGKEVIKDKFNIPTSVAECVFKKAMDVIKQVDLGDC